MTHITAAADPIPSTTDVFTEHLNHLDKKLMGASDVVIKNETLTISGQEVRERFLRIDNEIRRAQLLQEHLVRLKAITKAAILDIAGRDE